MSTGHVLEMINKEHVYGGTARRANHRNGLGGGLFRHDNSEARCDSRDQARDGWRGPVHDSPSRNMGGSFANRLPQSRAHSPVTAFGSVIRLASSAQGEYFETV